MVGLEPYIRKKTQLIWDWNGTLLNDVRVCVDIISDLLEKHSLPRLTIEDYRQKFRFPVSTYYESLGFDFTETSFEALADTFIKNYLHQVKGCHLFEGVKTVLIEWHTQGKRQSLLSAARETDLKKLLKHHGLEGFFQDVYGLPDHYAEGKRGRAEDLLAQIKVPAEEVLLIGDTEHDYEVAAHLGIDVLLLGDGHQCPSRLRRTGAPVLESRY